MAKPLVINSQSQRRWSPVAAYLALCLATCIGGCRAVDSAQVDVLERELRQQEDYIYELEDYLMEYSEKLRQCRSCSGPTMMESTPTITSATKRPGLHQPTLADDSNLDTA